MNPTNSIKSIAIVGAGVTGWTVAAALAHGLRGLGIEIFLVDDPDYREIDSYCETCLPASLSFFQILGINEQEFMIATQANYSLANHYQSWAYEGQNYFMPFSEHGFMLNRIEFPQYAISRHLQGDKTPYDAYSLGAVAARKGRFRTASSQVNSLYSTLSYGIQLNSEDYANYLMMVARRKGVKHIQAKIIQVLTDLQAGAIEALHLGCSSAETTVDKDGKLHADFYIDCTGLQSLLIEQTLKVPFISAEHELPANAVAYFVKPAHKVNNVSSSLRPDLHGWLATTHTQKQEQVEYYFHAGSANCNPIMETLRSFGDIEKSLQFRPLKIGRCENFWHKNCIAIGEASGNLNNFIVSKSHLVQSAVLRVLSLFPGSLEANYQQREYNRLTHLELDHIEDLHRLHYYLPNPKDSEFWSSAKASVVSERLEHKLQTFKQRGIIPFYEGETLSSGIWISLLLGSGYWPQRHDPMVLNIESSWINQQLTKMQKMIGEAANAMPTIGDYLSKSVGNQKIQA